MPHDIALIGAATCEFGDDWCRTTLSDGRQIMAMAERTESYHVTAATHGYGLQIEHMCVEHELTHSLLAHWLGLTESPTFRRVADGNSEATDLLGLKSGPS